MLCEPELLSLQAKHAQQGQVELFYRVSGPACMLLLIFPGLQDYRLRVRDIQEHFACHW
jgi:hypothetical protein